MAKAHFEGEGHFDHANRVQRFSLEIDRDAGLVRVRIHGRREVDELPLESVAQMIHFKAVQHRVMEAKQLRGTRKIMAKRGMLSRGR